MLSFFPTPYPDELWYSILCRYHVRSGNPSSHITTKELNIKEKSLASLLPTSSISIIINQLPNGFLDIKDIILNNTMFKYAYRFYSLELKQEFLKNFELGKAIAPQRLCRQEQIRPVLKSCPLCRSEDLEKYGEQYWHLSHQLPLAYYCRKHGCRLTKYEIGDKRKRNYYYILPGVCDEVIDYNILSYERFLTDTSLQYLHLPLEVSPDFSYNNLYNGLINEGYSIFRDGLYYVNVNKIAHALCDLFGNEMIEKYFVSTNINHALFFQFRRWNIKSPERYAMIAALINQSPEITFSSVELELNVYKKMKEIKNTYKSQSKIYIAKQLGVKVEHLDAIACQLGIEKFWECEIQKKNTKMVISTTHEEKKKISEYYKSHGYRNCNDFVLYCIKKEMEKNVRLL